MTARAGAALLVIVAWGIGSACTDPSRDGAAKPLVKLRTRAITAAEVVLAARAGIGESREERLERIVGTALLAQDARERGIADAPDVQAKLCLVRARAALEEDALLAQELFERERADAAPSEASLRVHYEKTKGRYLAPMLRLRRVAFTSRQAAEAAHGRLGAEGRLDPASAEAIGPTEIQRLPAEVLPEVLGLRVAGQRVVAGNGLEGFSLVELVESLPASPRPLEEVREWVAREVATAGALAALQTRARALRERAEIEIEQAALADDATFAELERVAESMRSRLEPATRAAPGGGAGALRF